MIPEGRVHRPAATRADFREWPDLPGLSDLAATPGTIAHESRESAVAVPAPAVVAHTRRPSGGRRGEARAETPRAERPLGHDALVAARADMAQRRISIETVMVTAAPRADQHALGDRLAAVGAAEDDRHDRAVALDKGSAAHLLPVELVRAGRSDSRGELEIPGNGGEQGRAHLLGVCEPLGRIDRKGLLDKADKCQAGSFAEALVAPGRPAEGPPGQKAGDVLVEDQRYGETIAAIRRPAVSLLGSNVTGRTKIVDGPHPAFDLQADAEIAECGSAVRKEKDIARRNVAMDHAFAVGVSQAVKNLGGNRKDPAHGHGPGAIVQRADRQFGRQHGVVADDVGVLDRHNVGMAQ